MKMLPSDAMSLRDSLGKMSQRMSRFLADRANSIALAELARGSCLRDRLSILSAHSVLIATRDQLATALALIELDGVVRRLTLCPPDLPHEYLPLVIANVGIDAIVCDRDATEYSSLGVPLHFMDTTAINPIVDSQLNRYPTEWVLLTSGTTGLPKMVAHSLASLTAAINTSKIGEKPTVWGTFYDVRRYGGLQVFFRAILGGGSFVLSSVGEPLSQYLDRLGAHHATHVLGTPSHWRRVLMSPSASAIAPQYVRLSGEMVDQTILDSLHAFYPRARIGHAFASTEAGVAFEVTDGFEGFPADIVGRSTGDVVLKIEDGSLRVRSPGAAKAYVGQEASMLTNQGGFVDTGDIVERRGDRYYFLGRRGGIINVGGLKIHPEEVEAVINRHPAVRMSAVRSRRSPITGSIVVADVVLKVGLVSSSAPASSVNLKEEILQLCRDALAEHKVPAAIRFVADLNVGAAGKLLRHA
jgi:acyl-coenzyme A synthetase/AMP-(fatty) acid ligase